MAEIEIDDIKITVADDASIIEAADQAGIYIPRFCYHKKLSIAANCRMCLVEVEKVGKPLPACATPVSDGMKVFTRSKKALDAQRAVMEFLLINHPLDCPICDQGGVCELQDFAVGFGRSHSIYNEPKRSRLNEDIGPLVATEMTRCINCTRCVRFGDEIAGMPELGVIGRGENCDIGTYVQHFLQSELSGNVTDICPVGALTTKPNRFKWRGWEVWERAGIAPHDCVGSNIYIQTRGHALHPKRDVHNIVPRMNEDVNECWISDRDRFSFLGLKHKDRVMEPQIKSQGRWKTVSWQRALAEIADKILAITQHQGPEQLAALISPNSTLEECFLLQKLMRTLGSNNIDHRYRQLDFKDQQSFPISPHSNLSMTDIEELSDILLIGSNIRVEAPLLAVRINKASQLDAHIMAINPMDYSFSFPVQHSLVGRDIETLLAEVVHVLAAHNNKQHPELSSVKPSKSAQLIANQLLQAEKPALVLGEHALSHPRASQIRALAHLVAEYVNASQVILLDGANSTGAWIAGAIPHRGPAGAAVEPGLNAKQLLVDKPVRAYILFNSEVEYDSAYAQGALQAMQQAGLVICMSSFSTASMREYADFILPIAPFTETAGTFINIEGRWQSFSMVTEPHGNAKPGWKVIRALATFLQLDGFDYKKACSIKDELHDLMKAADGSPTDNQSRQLKAVTPLKADLIRLGSWPIYRGDPLVRRSEALQQACHHVGECVVLNPHTARALNLQEGAMVSVSQLNDSIQLALTLDPTLAENMAFVPSGYDKMVGWGEIMQAVTISVEDDHA